MPGCATSIAKPAYAMPPFAAVIRCLDGIANRCSGQLYKGERTHIGWTANEIVLPTVPCSMASAAIIKVAGITGRIRGMKYKRADGQTVRPSLVVLDDPQTDESARSLSQCATRERIILSPCGKIPLVSKPRPSYTCLKRDKTVFVRPMKT